MSATVITNPLAITKSMASFNEGTAKDICVSDRPNMVYNIYLYLYAKFNNIENIESYWSQDEDFPPEKEKGALIFKQ